MILPFNFNINQEVFNKISKDSPITISFDQDAYRRLSNEFYTINKLLKNKINLVLENIKKSKNIFFKILNYVIISFITLYTLTPYIKELQNKKKKPNKIKIFVICLIIGLFIFGIEAINLFNTIFNILFG